MDVRAKRGADVGSDHNMVVATVRVKLRKTGGKRPERQRFDVEKLQDLKVKGSFVLQLKNKFQALADLEDYMQSDQEGVNTKWEIVKTAYLQTSKTCLGTNKKKKKEWITAETWQAINTRRDLKKQFLEDKSERLKERHKQQYKYQEANRKVKRLARVDKRTFMDDLASQAKDAASQVPST